MNLEKMEELANWLEQGAPHIVFDMHSGSEPIDEFSSRKARIEADHKGIGECGTVCCIAGYAAHLSGTTGPTGWSSVREIALKALDLPRTNHDFYGHDLFDPNLAPNCCTPQQAAVAVRRVMEGKEPWA